MKKAYKSIWDGEQQTKRMGFRVKLASLAYEQMASRKTKKVGQECQGQRKEIMGGMVKIAAHVVQLGFE